MKDAFLKKGWEDGEDDMLEDENYKFDFSYYNFNFEQKGNIRCDQLIQGHKGLYISTKIGMLNVLKNAARYKKLDYDFFFPKTFDLSSRLDFESFIRFYILQTCVS